MCIKYFGEGNITCFISSNIELCLLLICLHTTSTNGSRSNAELRIKHGMGIKNIWGIQKVVILGTRPCKKDSSLN